MSLQVLDARPDASAGYKVDLSRGSRVGRVSSEWFSRPDDERFLSLADLHAAEKGRATKSRTRTVENAKIRVEASDCQNTPKQQVLDLSLQSSH
jgi:hypothetical protein